MSFFPKDQFNIKTSKSIEQVAWIMQENTEAYRPSYFWKASGKMFWGNVTGYSFEIQPVNTFRNSFAPVIKGKINNDVIDVDMRPHIFVTIFMSFWLLICVGFILVATATMIINQEFELPLTLPYLMFFFGYSIFILSFRHEAKKAKIKLQMLLEDHFLVKSDKLKKSNKVVRIIITMIAVCLVLFGFIGFLASATGTMNDMNPNIYHDQHSLNDKNGIAVDSFGNIYIGEGETGSIQMYDHTGLFQYGWSFPTGGGGWFVFGIDKDQIHVVTARTDSYFVFKDGELVYSEENISYEHSRDLQKRYNMSETNCFIMDNTIYRISFLNTVKIENNSAGYADTIQLNAPAWPFPVFAFWMIAAVGMALLFMLHYKRFFSLFEQNPV